jgi:hypothetical protein
MEDVKHAPAPWLARRDKAIPEFWTVEAEEGRTLVCHLYGIRDVPKGKPDLETEATAKLIAAAPDLLEALVLVLPKLGWYTARELGDDVVKKIEAAIAKATQP